VEKLGGVVSVESQPDAGTTFRLLLPMTLAIFRGVLVREQEQVFLLPSVNVERVLRVRPEEIRTVENRETLNIDGGILSTVRLGDVMELPARRHESSSFKVPDAPASNPIPVVVLAFADKRMAFQVDEVLDELQVLVKGLGKQLGRVRNIAGATILGTGKVVPILNVSDLMLSAVRTAASARTATAGKAPAKVENILVAEDSITSRTLIKSILETAGYRVTTAVDGEDAFAQVRSGEFDIVVSDVDMPRMSGFELTANAYIVKSSFDQSNLLEVVRRLI
jgi:two-component system chemotaxis sensor kinase CheA